jgi:tRNA (guanosine-2'-O-)-methyltransferase
MYPERKEKVVNVLNRRQPDIAVVLENVNDPHNIFAVMRTCDAAGIQNLYILNNIIGKHRNLDRLGKRSSSGAKHWLTIHEYEDTAACMQEVKDKYQNVYATHLSEEATSLYSLDLAGPVALVFGSEAKGITECLSYCTGNFVIPQVGMVQSLNISVACAVSVYEAYRQRELKGYYNGEARISSEERAELSKKWKLYRENED